jgi:hypothetical protein
MMGWAGGSRETFALLRIFLDGLSGYAMMNINAARLFLRLDGRTPKGLKLNQEIPEKISPCLRPFSELASNLRNDLVPMAAVCLVGS